MVFSVEIDVFFAFHLQGREIYDIIHLQGLKSEYILKIFS
jgi:hypothetical protein